MILSRSNPSSGLAATFGVSALAFAVIYIFPMVSHSAGLDPMMVAILIGAVVRSAGLVPAGAEPGIRLASRRPLEIAIALMGAGLGLDALSLVTPGMTMLIAGAVALSIILSYAAGRAFGLCPPVAMMVACGNSICGNSAIMAVGPAVGATEQETGTTITFTASLSIVVILALPVLGASLGLTAAGYGIFAGMSVYAVPQVVAATATTGMVSAQVGAVVKLLRVLCLGPVLAALGFVSGSRTLNLATLRKMVPWYVAVFFLLGVFRVNDLLPQAAISFCGMASTILPVLAMAALGLLVDLRSLIDSGPRVLAAGLVSVGMLLIISTVVVTLAL